MAIQHWQTYCHTCKRPTLHIRNTYDVPHVAHLLATLFLCGLWLPIWILHGMLTSGEEPFLCQFCGTDAETSAAMLSQAGEGKEA